MTSNEIITIVIAIYGALLSTIIAIYQFKKDAYRLKLEIDAEKFPKLIN